MNAPEAIGARMHVFDIPQGSPAWQEHRRTHRNASDAPAMMGCSPYLTRNELLHRCYLVANGLPLPEVDPETQRRYDEGHRTERLCRPVAEMVLGTELYPLVVGDDTYSASLDGQTMLADINWEHKLCGADLSAAFNGRDVDTAGPFLPLCHRVQMAHQFHCSPATPKTLFSASCWTLDGQPKEVYHCWYERDEKLIADVLAGWAQFERDLADYALPEPQAPAPVAAAIEGLPALIVTVEGRVTSSNLAAYRLAADAFLGGIKEDLQTDEDFVNADRTVKFCDEGEKRLELVKAQALAQTATIDEVFRTIDHIKAQMREKRLRLDKLVKTRKTEIRDAEVARGRRAYLDHVERQNRSLDPLRDFMPQLPVNFAEAIKGLKTVDSLRNAVDTTLAHGKVAANAAFERLRKNRAALTRDGRDWSFLVADFGQVGNAEPDMFLLLLQQRIEGHQRAEEQRVEAARVEAAKNQSRALVLAACKAAAARVGEERVAGVLHRFTGGGDDVLSSEVDDCVAALDALGVFVDDARITPNAQETGSTPADAPAPATAGTYAGNAPQAAQGASSSDEGTAAHADQRAAAPAYDLPTIKLGDIKAKLGFALPADFISTTLKVMPAKVERAAVLYTPSQVASIKDALIEHIEAVL